MGVTRTQNSNHSAICSSQYYVYLLFQKYWDTLLLALHAQNPPQVHPKKISEIFAGQLGSIPANILDTIDTRETFNASTKDLTVDCPIVYHSLISLSSCSLILTALR